jgi:hypothetical protein
LVICKIIVIFDNPTWAQVARALHVLSLTGGSESETLALGPVLSASSTTGQRALVHLYNFNVF